MGHENDKQERTWFNSNDIETNFKWMNRKENDKQER